MILVISTALTLCSVAVTEDGHWPNSEDDPLMYISNPVESGMPGHWVPVSIVRAILERRAAQKRNMSITFADRKPKPAAQNYITTKPYQKSTRIVRCVYYMIGFYEGCMEEDGYNKSQYWKGTFPPHFYPEHPYSNPPKVAVKPKLVFSKASGTNNSDTNHSGGGNSENAGGNEPQELSDDDDDAVEGNKKHSKIENIIKNEENNKKFEYEKNENNKENKIYEKSEENKKYETSEENKKYETSEDNKKYETSEEKEKFETSEENNKYDENDTEGNVNGEISGDSNVDPISVGSDEVSPAAKPQPHRKPKPLDVHANSPI